MKIDYYGKVYRIIERLIEQGNVSFAIYPFGERGHMVRDMLTSRFGINSPIIFDNCKFEENIIIHKLCDAAEIEEKNELILLLASDNPSIYSDVRFEAMRYFGFERIIDMFSPSMYFDSDVLYDPSYFSVNAPSFTRFSLCESIMKEIYLNNISGATAECGVLKGEFADVISRCFPDRKLFLFDTFEGINDDEIPASEREKWDIIKLKTASRYFRDVPIIYEILRNIAYREHAVVKKGYFPETAVYDEEVCNERFCLVDIDMGFYDPTKAALHFFWERLVPGGYIFLDDVRHKGVYSVRQALDEFCKEKGVGYTTIQYWDIGLAVITKPLYGERIESD